MLFAVVFPGNSNTKKAQARARRMSKYGIYALQGVKKPIRSFQPRKKFWVKDMGIEGYWAEISMTFTIFQVDCKYKIRR